MTAANGDEQRPPPSSTQRRTEQADSSRPLSHAVPPPPPPPPPEGKTSNNNSKHHVRKRSITWTPNVEGANHSTPSPLGNPAFVADKRNDEAVVNPAMPVLSTGGALPSSADLPLPSEPRSICIRRWFESAHKLPCECCKYRPWEHIGILWNWNWNWN